MDKKNFIFYKDYIEDLQDYGWVKVRTRLDQGNLQAKVDWCKKEFTGCWTIKVDIEAEDDESFPVIVDSNNCITFLFQKKDEAFHFKLVYG